MTNPSADNASTNSSTPGSCKRPADPLTDLEIPVPQSRRRDSKVSRACDSCKAKKIRCSGTLPCDICTRRRLSCAYISKYSRGRPPTPPFSGPVRHEHPISCDQRQETRAIARAVSEGGVGSEFHRASLSSLGGGQGKTSQPVTDSLSPSRASPDLVIEGQYVDTTSGLSFLHRAWGKLLMREREMARYESTESERNQPLTSAGDDPFRCGHETIPELLCDDITARDLVRFYFDTCVVTYRMLHRHIAEGWLESILHDRRDGRQLCHSISHARSAIILTVLAIATFRKSKLANASSSNNTASLERSDHFFCTGMKMTDAEVGFPGLESAQARLMQVLYLLQTSRMNKAWYTFGRAFQIISSLGLHRRRGRIPSSYLKGSPDYISLQCGRRVFWVAYIIDKYLSVVFGRPRLLHDAEINQDFPDSVSDEDMVVCDHSSWQMGEECHIDSLIFHAKIARIIGRISRNIYSTATEENQDRVASASPLVGELHAWRASLPAHLGTVKPSALIPSFRREAIALQLAYSHALIHVNRPFLLGDGAPADGDPRVRERIEECISAARRTLETIEYMSNDTNLFHSFWWTHYVTFCALAVVYVWQIRSSSDDSAPLGGTYAGLFELAERCHSHLHEASSAASPSRRYGIILDEMRLEAKRQVMRNTHCHSMPGVAGLDNAFGESSNDNESSTVPGTLPERYVPIDTVIGGLPDLFQSWQTTDWLDLDSSAFYPIAEGFDLTS